MIEQAIWGSPSRRFTKAVWGGRPQRLVVAFGLPPALLVGLQQLAVTEAPGRALVAAALNGLIVGGLMSHGAWKRWPAGRALDPAGRVAVVRAVGRGGPVADLSLAPAVVDFAACVRHIAERDRKLRGTVRLLAFWPVPWAAFVSDDGPGWTAAVAWLFAALATTLALMATRAIDRRSVNAGRADALAREVDRT